MSSLSALQSRVEARKRKLLGEEGSSVHAKRWRRKGDIEKEAAEAYLARQALKEKSRVGAGGCEAAVASGTKECQSQEGYCSSVENADAKETLQHHTDAPPTSVMPASTGTTNGDSVGERGNLVSITDAPEAPEVSENPPIKVSEVIKRLRALGEPATLFGEDAWARFQRLRDHELAREGEGLGQKNIFQSKMRQMKRADAVRNAYEYSNATMSHQHRTGSNQARDLELNLEEKRVFTTLEDYVRHEIEKFVALWERDVNEMPIERRQTNKGRTAAATLEQTKDWLNPLLRRLRKRKVPSKILEALVNIFKAVEEREYVRANSFYYEQLAIGNAPWPMGATMVGIHARAAREKIGEDKIAHVMNDEESRKYIQGLKRLITLAQSHFPTVPSKMISS